MASRSPSLEASYERFYASRTSPRVYPTEFVVRTLLANYPGLNFRKPGAGARILDVGFGDGRNTAFLCDQGFAVSGIEIAQGIVDRTSARLAQLGHTPDLRVGRNSRIPFEDGYFDGILACHSCYYCDEGELFVDNLREYARVLKRGGSLIASIAARSSYIFEGAVECPDGSFVIANDPYGNRNGYRLQAFGRECDIEECMSPFFGDFSFGFADNNYYGVSERVFWVVCERRRS